MSFHPQTPQSPSQYSPSTTDPATSMTNSMPSISTTLPTPAHSVNGSSLPSEMAAHDAAMLADDYSNKRKRHLDDTGDREQKKVHIEDRRGPGIESLHLDVGEKYLLCRTPHIPTGPNLVDDLFERFGLTSIAAEVARTLPNGEKNAIRKTYKGHIKKLGVAGHFDSVKEDENRPDGFLAIVKFPEEEWNIHHVKGQEIQNGIRPDIRAKMPKAMTMAKGILPKSYWDYSVLGDLGPGGNVGKPEKQTPSARPTAPSTPLPVGAAASGAAPPRAKSQLPPGQDVARPKRSVKKRTYGDSSYEGYGEAFPDDDLGPGSGYSTGEGEMGASQKRKKKNQAGGQPYSQVRQPSYGPGMVGA